MTQKRCRPDILIVTAAFKFLLTALNMPLKFKGNRISVVKVRRSHKCHDGVIKWKHFPRYWRFVREIHRSPVNFPHKGQWRGALMFSVICAWMNGWVNTREAGDLRRHRAHYELWRHNNGFIGMVVLNLERLDIEPHSRFLCMSHNRRR